jgi:hypothetical protein
MAHEPSHPYDEVVLEGFDMESMHSNEGFDTFSPFNEQEDQITEGEDEPVYEFESEFQETAFELEDESAPVQLYNKLNLSTKKLAEDIFTLALKGYHELKQNGKLKNEKYVSIVDFSQPGNAKRMYILDVPGEKLMMQCKVSHGKRSVKSGDNKKNATLFSNRVGSNQSSLGFYVTLGTYQGKHGLSLALEGQEDGFNNDARRRRVVIHGADYVKESDDSAAGLSWGCPAVDMKLVTPIINMIKGGSCLFLFARDSEYLNKSTFVSGTGIIGRIRDVASAIMTKGSQALSTLAAQSPEKATSSSTSRIDKNVVQRINKYREVIERVSKEKAFNPNIVRGIIAAESGGNPRAGEGRSGYKGLMQAERGTDQFDPETSIRRGIDKFIGFKQYLKSGIARLKLSITLPTNESYAQMVLACYNAGHVTVLKALQYAHQKGNWQEWLAPENYYRALLFSGGYDMYDNCGKGRSPIEIQNARVQRLGYRYDRKKQWWTHKDPPDWAAASSSLSPVLRCWIQTKAKNTPGYLNRFLAYFNAYSNQPDFAKEAREDEYFLNEYTDQESDLGEMEGESPEQFYGPEYFDSSERSQTEEFTEDEHLHLIEPWISEEYEEGAEGEEESPDYGYRTSNEWTDSEAVESEDEPVYELEEELYEVPTAGPPVLLGEDSAVPGYTVYLKIPIGKGNYALDKTGVYVPAHFNPSRPADIILYLHGMTGTFPGPTAMIDKYWTVTKLPAYDFRIREDVNASGKNAVLVAPSLGNSPNAYRNHLSNREGGLDTYMLQVIEGINHYVCRSKFNGSQINLNRIIIAAHSAGGSQMRNIVTSRNPVFGNRVRECWGLDSLYGGVYRWVSWAKNNADKKLFIYFKSSTHGNAMLLKSLAKKLSNVAVIESSAKNHYLVVRKHLKERLDAL